MTFDDLKKFVTEKLKLNKVDVGNADAFLQLSIPAAVNELWNKYPWEEKRKTKSIAIVSGDYSVDVPDDCLQATELKFAGSTLQGNIDIYSESYFDGYYPNLAEASAGRPCMAKVVYDGINKKSVIYLGPKSDSDYTLELVYRRKAPGIDEVPEYLEATLIAIVEKNVFLPGSPTHIAYGSEVAREASTASNNSPKGAPIKSNMQASLREGRHIFYMGEGYDGD